MPEKKTKVDVHMMEYVCDKCNKGMMGFIGQRKPGVDGRSMMMLHKCSACGALQAFKNIMYPTPKYEQAKIIE